MKHETSVMQLVTGMISKAKMGSKPEVMTPFVAHIERGLWVVDMKIL